MSNKFAVGDRVRIVASPYEDESLSVGKEGIILKTYGGMIGPLVYGVSMNDEMDALGGWSFYEDELENSP